MIGVSGHGELRIQDGAQFTHTGTLPTLGTNGATGIVDTAKNQSAFTLSINKIQDIAG